MTKWKFNQMFCSIQENYLDLNEKLTGEKRAHFHGFSWKLSDKIVVEEG